MRARRFRCENGEHERFAQRAWFAGRVLLDDGSMHLTAGNTSAGVASARVYEAVLIDMSNTFHRIMSAWEPNNRTNRESQVRRDFHFHKGKRERSQNTFAQRGA